MAKLWAIRYGPHLAWAEGFRFVIIESNSSVAIQSIQCLEKTDPNFNLCHEIRALIARYWCCNLELIWREANICADHLAKLVKQQRISDVVFRVPPTLLLSSFDQDLQGFGSLRNSSL
ncbi:hypothetical protein LOK49_LG01G00945 [Camellia lanceoleosa]|uniref:Uncharacterized protein n=1 Tax=Camellia lanceoleosa TaxID=1840588 RepID=A0ACC0J486_9ERIC|nr:hypothetical protein LOK49_LG01G00945 [Camellia lanceoleosa]